MPLYSIKDVLFLTIVKTSTPRVASQRKISPELLERSLGEEGECAGVNKRTSSNDPSLSTISFAVGVLGRVEMRIYPLVPLMSALTAGIL